MHLEATLAESLKTLSWESHGCLETQEATGFDGHKGFLRVLNSAAL